VQEVKESANALIAYTPWIFLYRFGSPHADDAELFRDTTELLVRKTTGGQLHWRESVVAELLFMHVAPCIDDSPMLESIVAAQVHDMLNGSTVVAKVRPTSLHVRLGPMHVP
jgi:hypothetical protein